MLENYRTLYRKLGMVKTPQTLLRKFNRKPIQISLKIIPKSSQILPKPSQNPPQIHPKSIENKKNREKNVKKCHDDLRCAQHAKKMRKNAKNVPKTPPKGAGSKMRHPPRTLLQRGRSPSQGRNCEGLMSRTSNTRGVRTPAH